MIKHKNSTRNPKTLFVIAVLLLMHLTPVFATDEFDYKTAKPPKSYPEGSFYHPPASDQTLKNISGQSVRNVILCIGDGMAFNHIALTRHRTVGPDGKLHMERLPITGIVRTHTANDPVTDSAAAGTAIACGIKTNRGMVGMTPDKIPYSSILELLDGKGWRTGLVATAEISHATPATFASHVNSRGKQAEIALQLWDNRVDVLLGGGQKYWPQKRLAEAAADGYQIVQTREAMLGLESAPAIGLFAHQGMTTFAPEPSLQEMAEAAIKMLSAPSKEWFAPKPKFFLMIEGSQIDWAAHGGETDNVVRQTLLFDMAVRTAIEFAQADKKTLVIVVADHETGGLLVRSKQTTIHPDWNGSGHTAGDVPIFAFGPGSEKFSGVMDNTEISKHIAELTGIKEFPVIRKQSRTTDKVPIK